MITESIFDGKTTIIPMADVQHVEKHWFGSEVRTKDNYAGIKIITRHTKYNMEADCWEKNPWVWVINFKKL